MSAETIKVGGGNTHSDQADKAQHSKQSVAVQVAENVVSTMDQHIKTQTYLNPEPGL